MNSAHVFSPGWGSWQSRLLVADPSRRADLHHVTGGRFRGSERKFDLRSSRPPGLRSARARSEEASPHRFPVARGMNADEVAAVSARSRAAHSDAGLAGWALHLQRRVPRPSLAAQVASYAHRRVLAPGQIALFTFGARTSGSHALRAPRHE